MPYQIHLFDASDNRVAILQDEILTSADLDPSMSAAPTLTISMPLSEAKSSFISPLYYAKIYNENTAAYEYSVFELENPNIEDTESSLQIKAEYQGILTRLSDEYIDAYDTGSAGDTFTNVITDILAFQLNTPTITVGTLEPTPTVAIALESTDIYSALKSIRDAYGGWFEVDSSYRLNWWNDNTDDPMREIRRSKNLKSLKYTPQYSKVVNRVYAYGKGESTARINLIDAGEAHEYIEDAASQALYGVRAKKYIDKSITHPATLLAYAQRILAEYKTPPCQYNVDVVNLAEVADYDYSLESLGLDTRIRVIDDLLLVDVDTSIVNMSINLLAPENISVELNTVKNDLSDLFGKVLSVQDIQSSVAAQFGPGQIYLNAVVTVKDWLTDGTTEINGSNITTGSITLSTVNGGSGSIQSADYSAGSDGWKINSAGDAEFNDVTIRGNLDACSVGSGKTLSVLGNITLEGTADFRLYGSGTIGFKLLSTQSYYSLLLLGGDDGGIIVKDADYGTASISAYEISVLETNTDNEVKIQAWSGGSAVRLGNNSKAWDIELLGADGSITCTGDLTCENILCVDITCDDISCDNIDTTGIIYFGVNALSESGGHLYWNGTRIDP